MRSPTEVLEVERPRHIRTRFGNLILKGESDVTFAPEGDGTRLTQAFRTRGIVAAIFARIFAAGSYAGSFQGELRSVSPDGGGRGKGLSHAQVAERVGR